MTEGKNEAGGELWAAVKVSVSVDRLDVEDAGVHPWEHLLVQEMEIGWVKRVPLLQNPENKAFPSVAPRPSQITVGEIGESLLLLHVLFSHLSLSRHIQVWEEVPHQAWAVQS